MPRKHRSTSLNLGLLASNAQRTGRDGSWLRTQIDLLSSAGLDIPADTPLPQKLVTRLVMQRLYRHGYDDMRRMESALHDVDARWTIVRPPMLSNAPRTGSYRTSIGAPLPNMRSIPRADLARYMLAAVDDPATWQSIVEITGDDAPK